MEDPKSQRQVFTYSEPMAVEYALFD
jgi:hypothetical protein